MKRIAIVVSLLLLALIGGTHVSSVRAATPLQLMDVEQLASIIDSPTTRQVNLTTFVLGRRSPVRTALKDACRRGAHADVLLDGRDFIRQDNQDTINDLRAAGCSASFSRGPLHMKLAYVNNVAYLTDTNWAHGYVVRDDDPSDRSLIAQTLAGHPGSNSHFSTLKRDSLALESAAINATRGDLWFESESFGDGNPVYDALQAAASSHRHVRIMVASAELEKDRREAIALGRLAAAGAEVRVTRETEKMAITSDGVLIGSTNSTAGVGDQIDWSLFAADRGLVTILADRYGRIWNDARPL